MGEFSFTDKEFEYLGFSLFTIGLDIPEDWEEYDFDEMHLDILHKLYAIYLERERLLTMEEKDIDDVLDTSWKITFSEEQIDFITGENEVVLQDLINDPEFEEYLERGNRLLKIFSKPPLSLADFSTEPST